jgi:hypothetical protein
VHASVSDGWCACVSVSVSGFGDLSVGEYVSVSGHLSVCVLVSLYLVILCESARDSVCVCVYLSRVI